MIHEEKHIFIDGLIAKLVEDLEKQLTINDALLKGFEVLDGNMDKTKATFQMVRDDLDNIFVRLDKLEAK